MNNPLSPHEILNLQELLKANILEAKLITNNIPSIQDENLKQLMQDYLNGKKAKLKELEDFINNNIMGQTNNQNQNNS